VKALWGQPAGNSPAFSSIRPGLRLAGLLDQAAGPGKRYTSLDEGATVVAAGRWDALESWCAAQKLAALRELIRRMPATGHEARGGGLPDVWRNDLTEQIALELGITKNAADALIHLAWTLERRLPLTAAALDSGQLNLSKARMIADETSVLSDEDAGQAETLVARQWAGKTWSQIRSRIARAVVEIDPEGATRRREQAEKEEARVRFWRENAGTAAIAGYALPTDQALIAMANVRKRARAYKRWGIPEPMYLLRVRAMLDLLSGIDSRTKFPKIGTRGGARQDGKDQDKANAAGEPQGEDLNADDDSDTEVEMDLDDDGTAQDDDGQDDDGQDDDDGGPGGGGGDGPSGNDGSPPGGAEADDLSANLQLTIPLATLLGLRERPGEARGLGVIDPGLARRLAARAARSPQSSFEVIVTDSEGRAIGFGKANRTRRRARPGADKPPGQGQGLPGRPGDKTSTATFAPTAATGAGPPDGYGAWTLTLGDLELTVRLAPIPMGECDHQYESAGYQPSDTLRRLVQIRDGECTMPVCVSQPRSCDWDHAIPWPQGRTCGCNGGLRCRHDHRIKQSRGWKVEQIPGGWHLWTTPSGLSYISEPYQYPDLYGRLILITALSMTGTRNFSRREIGMSRHRP